MLNNQERLGKIIGNVTLEEESRGLDEEINKRWKRLKKETLQNRRRIINNEGELLSLTGNK